MTEITTPAHEVTFTLIYTATLIEGEPIPDVAQDLADNLSEAASTAAFDMETGVYNVEVTGEPQNPTDLDSGERDLIVSGLGQMLAEYQRCADTGTTREMLDTVYGVGFDLRVTELIAKIRQA